VGEKKVRVYPHPRLAETNEWLPGIGADGADVPQAEAEQLVEGGFAVLDPVGGVKSARPKSAKSKSAPAEPAEPEA
jgi:hypothetical protein